MALQIFIKSQTTSIKLSVSSTDTVFQVKRKLQKKLGIKVEHQRYFYGYAELKEKDHLRDYNIKHSQLLMMTAITTNGQSQFVFFSNLHFYKFKHIFCSLVSLEVEPSDTLHIIKSKLSQKEQIEFASISSVYFAGEMPENKSISECNVMNNSIIHLMEIADHQSNDNWHEYQQMFRRIKWKNIPKKYNEDEHDPYYHLIAAVNKVTNSKPTKIKNQSQFVNILKQLDDFSCVDGCDYNANNFYDAYKAVLLDKNMKKQLHKDYNAISKSDQRRLKYLEMTDLNGDTEESMQPLFVYDKGEKDKCWCHIL